MDGQQWPGVRGKRVILTGGTGGIGLAAARQLAALGAELTIVGRSSERAQVAVASIERPVDVLLADPGLTGGGAPTGGRDPPSISAR